MLRKTITFLFIAALLFAGIFFAHKSFRNHGIVSHLKNKIPAFSSDNKNNAYKKIHSFPACLLDTLHSLEADTSGLVSHIARRDSTVNLQIEVPKGLPLPWIVWSLGQCADNTSYEVADCIHYPEKGTCRLSFSSSKKNNPNITLTIGRSSLFYSATGKMAILLEDFGFEANQTTIDFLSFSKPLTVSLVPIQKKSSWTAQIADEYKKEIIIALPMESQYHSMPNYRDAAIMIHYSENKIIQIINDAMRLIPNFSGFSNLYGSRLLLDTRVTSIILQKIHKHHGYFIDMKTTEHSVVPQIAHSIGLPHQKIDGSIDTDKSVDSIIEQLRHYILVARKNGSCLVTGKATQDFITALTKTMPVFEYNGIKLVYVSELVKHP
ncbi:MAG: hypothetical protein GF401_06790 [Chitinivibrionales bacterium]|nr:hypothetical protein [Chitinivibrionales bacterium]